MIPNKYQVKVFGWSSSISYKLPFSSRAKRSLSVNKYGTRSGASFCNILYSSSVKESVYFLHSTGNTCV